MNPVLLYTDTKKINEGQTTLTNMVGVFQNVYNAIVAAGVTSPTLNEIFNLVNSAKAQKLESSNQIYNTNSLLGTPTYFVANYMLNKLVSQVMPYVVNGIAWPAQKVKEIITLPDLTTLEEALQVVWGGNYKNVVKGEGTEYFSYLSAANGVISAVEGANATIASKFTFYTQNDQSATLANQIQALCDQLNDYQSSYSNVNLPKVLPAEYRVYSTVAQTAIPGVGYVAGTGFVINYRFVQSYESHNNTIMADMI